MQLKAPLYFKGEKFKNYLFKPVSTQHALSCQNSRHEFRSEIKETIFSRCPHFPFLPHEKASSCPPVQDKTKLCLMGQQRRFKVSLHSSFELLSKRVIMITPLLAHIKNLSFSRTKFLQKLLEIVRMEQARPISHHLSTNSLSH